MSAFFLLFFFHVKGLPFLCLLRSNSSSLTMFTTVVPDSLGGRGVAKLLADEAFEFAVKEQVTLKLQRLFVDNNPNSLGHPYNICTGGAEADLLVFVWLLEKASQG